MSTPSLLNVPYRLKAGTLYSQIPETGLGDFVVTRATSPANNLSTRVNSLGFIERVSDGVPRLDYPLGGAVNGCPALLVEPSAANLLFQSEAFNTTWSALNGATVTPNTIASPDNNVTADTINLTTASESRVQQGSITIANSTTYTMSCFYKNIALTAGQTFRMRFNNTNSAPNEFIATAVIDLAAGTATYSIGGTSGTGFSGTATGRVDNYGNGWYRISMTFTAGTAGATATGIFEVGNNTSGALRSFYAWGAQFEVGSVATSYIPTTTAAIARGADVIRKTSITSLIGQSEGTVYFEVEVTDEARNKWFCTLDSASNSFIQMWVNPTRQINAQINNSGTIVVSPLASSVLAIGYHKVAFAYNTATNGCIMYVDGVQNPATTRTVGSPGLPAFNDMRFGGYIAGTTESIKGHVRAGAVYPNRLSNSELATLTTP
jgi:hypothetical protein